jgi:hypothetical protein
MIHRILAVIIAAYLIGLAYAHAGQTNRFDNLRVAEAIIFGGETRTNWPTSGSGGTTTQQVIDITAPLYAPIGVTNVDTSAFVTNGGFVINVVGGETQTVSNAGSITITPGTGSSDMSWTNGAATTTTAAGAIFTNGLLFGYSPVLYSGGNTGLATDAMFDYLTAAQISAAGGLTNGQGGTAGAITNNQTGVTLSGTFKGLVLGLPPGAALVYGSTNDALLAGISGVNAYWDELQFSDTTEQRARYVIPAYITDRWTGAALTNQVWWRGTTNAGAVVWQIAMVGRTNETLVDVAYQNSTIVTQTVSSTTSNLNVATITFTPTNSVAGSLWLYELRRIPGNGGDTMVGDARVVSVGVKE